MRDAYSLFSTVHVAEDMFNFTAYLQSVTGFCWDETELTLYTIYAVSKRCEAYSSSAKLLQRIQFHIQSIYSIFFTASEKNAPFIRGCLNKQTNKQTKISFNAQM